MGNEKDAQQNTQAGRLLDPLDPALVTARYRAEMEKLRHERIFSVGDMSEGAGVNTSAPPPEFSVEERRHLLQELQTLDPARREQLAQAIAKLATHPSAKPFTQTIRIREQLANRLVDARRDMARHEEKHRAYMRKAGEALQELEETVAIFEAFPEIDQVLTMIRRMELS